MTKQVVSFEVFKTIVEVIAAERPDFVYERTEGDMCKYAPGGAVNSATTRCIIGEALHRLGWTDEELTALDCGSSGMSANMVLSGAGFDAQTQQWARSAQYKQDNGVSWSGAVAFANENRNVQIA